MGTNRPTRPRTSLDVTSAEMAQLRALAKCLGLLNTRGPAASLGEGSVTLLMRRLADAHERDPAGTAEQVAAILRSQKQ